MKRVIFFLLIFVNVNVHSQSTALRPTQSRFFSNRYKAVTIKNNDILVYKLTKDTGMYTLFVTIKEYSNAIHLDYSINSTDSNSYFGTQIHKGKIIIPEAAKNEASKYDSLITDSMATLKNEIAFFLSNKNFSELYYVKESQLDLGNKLESFRRSNTSVVKMKLKGRDSFITVFNMENTGKKPKRNMRVLSDQKNPLIVMMDAGKWKIELKEIR